MNTLKFYVFILFFLSKETFSCSIDMALSSGVGESVSVSVDKVYVLGGDSALSLNFVDKKTQSLMAFYQNRENVTNFEEFFDAICNTGIILHCSKKRLGSVDFIEKTDNDSKTIYVPNFRDGILVGYVVKSSSIDDPFNCKKNFHEHVIIALNIFFNTGDIVDVSRFLESKGEPPSPKHPL